MVACAKFHGLKNILYVKFLLLGMLYVAENIPKVIQNLVFGEEKALAIECTRVGQYY